MNAWIDRLIDLGLDSDVACWTASGAWTVDRFWARGVGYGRFGTPRGDGFCDTCRRMTDRVSGDGTGFYGVGYGCGYSTGSGYGDRRGGNTAWGVSLGG